MTSLSTDEVIDFKFGAYLPRDSPKLRHQTFFQKEAWVCLQDSHIFDAALLFRDQVQQPTKLGRHIHIGLLWSKQNPIKNFGHCRRRRCCCVYSILPDTHYIRKSSSSCW